MHLHPRIWTAVAFLAIPLLTGCGLSLAGDITPPPNYIAPTDSPVENSYEHKTGKSAGCFPARSP